jgi:hypothetical protein
MRSNEKIKLKKFVLNILQEMEDEWHEKCE